MAKVVLPLTDSVIRSLKPKANSYIKADGNNLFISVSPGNSKSWQFIYLHPVTKERKKKTIGKYPAVSLVNAREKVRDFHRLLADNMDPFEYAKEQAEIAQRNAITVREMAEIWKTKKQSEVLAGTFKDLWGRLEIWLFPLFGDVPINKIELPAVINAFEPAYQMRPDTVRKVARYFINILDRAVILGYLQYNPLASMKGEFRKPIANHQPAIHYSELPLFMRLLGKSNLLPLTKMLIEWQLLTMVRPAEAVSAEWSEIDFKNAVWHIPAHKMKGLRDKKKAHSVPLSRQTLELLEEIKKAGYPDSPFLFPHRTDRKKHYSNGTANNAIKRIDNGSYKGKFTSHGIRSTARTYLTEINIDHFVAESCLSHVAGNEVSRVYNRSNYLNARREAMQKWADYVEQCKKV